MNLSDAALLVVPSRCVDTCSMPCASSRRKKSLLQASLELAGSK